MSASYSSSSHMSYIHGISVSDLDQSATLSLLRQNRTILPALGYFADSASARMGSNL